MSKKKPEWAKEDNPEYTSTVMDGVSGIKPPRRLPIKRKELTVQDYVKGVLNSDRVKLAQTITLIESQSKSHRKMADEVLQKLLPHSGKSIRVGISGVPGVGKSSFIEKLGLLLVEQGHKVAVLAVDPSSPLSGGSILGDKTRMEHLSRNQNAFVRPSPSAGVLGGVANKTRECMLVCEAAGYDYILIETVGVGQSEFEVANMVDFFLLLLLPNAGDELQGIKKGILETCHAIAINKADGDLVDLAKVAKGQCENALHYAIRENKDWRIPVFLTSTLSSLGLEGVISCISSYIEILKKNNRFQSHRSQQNIIWLEHLLKTSLLDKFYSHSKVALNLDLCKEKVASGEITPMNATENLLKSFLESKE